jgi:hypothetical protein
MNRRQQRNPETQDDDDAAKIQYTTCRYTSLKLPATGQYTARKNTEVQKHEMFQIKDAQLPPTPTRRDISHMSIVKYKRHGDAEYMYIIHLSSKSFFKQTIAGCLPDQKKD